MDLHNLYTSPNIVSLINGEEISGECSTRERYENVKKINIITNTKDYRSVQRLRVRV